jgi:hypothetical protein
MFRLQSVSLSNSLAEVDASISENALAGLNVIQPHLGAKASPPCGRAFRAPCSPDPNGGTYRAPGQLVWPASLRHSLGPPGEVPLSMAITTYAVIGRSRIAGRFGHREAVIRLAATATAVKIHPSGERGPSPQPMRCGPNHAFFPIRGEVRMARF